MIGAPRGPAYDVPVTEPDLATHPVAAPDAAWRPMPIGTGDPRKIRDVIAEPHWGGRRVLVAIRAGEATLTDEDGAPIPGLEALHEALVAAVVGTDHVVLDGQLLAGPLGDGTGAFANVGMDSVATPGQMGRQLLLGGSSRLDRRRESAAAIEARGVPPETGGPAAFVAIDLLLLDATSLLGIPLLERKRLLESVLEESEAVRRTVAVRPPIEAWYSQWRALGFREVVLKSANGRYTPGTPAADWATLVIPTR